MPHGRRHSCAYTLLDGSRARIFYSVYDGVGLGSSPSSDLGSPGDIYISGPAIVYVRSKGAWDGPLLRDDRSGVVHPNHPNLVLSEGDKVSWVAKVDLKRKIDVVRREDGDERPAKKARHSKQSASQTSQEARETSPLPSPLPVVHSPASRAPVKMEPLSPIAGRQSTGDAPPVPAKSRSTTETRRDQPLAPEPHAEVTLESSGAGSVTLGWVRCPTDNASNPVHSSPIALATEPPPLLPIPSLTVILAPPPRVSVSSFRSQASPTPAAVQNFLSVRSATVRRHVAGDSSIAHSTPPGAAAESASMSSRHGIDHGAVDPERTLPIAQPLAAATPPAPPNMLGTTTPSATTVSSPTSARSESSSADQAKRPTLIGGSGSSRHASNNASARLRTDLAVLDRIRLPRGGGVGNTLGTRANIASPVSSPRKSATQASTSTLPSPITTAPDLQRVITSSPSVAASNALEESTSLHPPLTHNNADPEGSALRNRATSSISSVDEPRPGETEPAARPPSLSMSATSTSALQGGSTSPRARLSTSRSARDDSDLVGPTEPTVNRASLSGTQEASIIPERGDKDVLHLNSTHISEQVVESSRPVTPPQSSASPNLNVAPPSTSSSILAPPDVQGATDSTQLDAQSASAVVDPLSRTPTVSTCPPISGPTDNQVVPHTDAARRLTSVGLSTLPPAEVAHAAVNRLSSPVDTVSTTQAILPRSSTDASRSISASAATVQDLTQVASRPKSDSATNTQQSPLEIIDLTESPVLVHTSLPATAPPPALPIALPHRPQSHDLSSPVSPNPTSAPRPRNLLPRISSEVAQQPDISTGGPSRSALMRAPHPVTPPRMSSLPVTHTNLPHSHPAGPTQTPSLSDPTIFTSKDIMAPRADKESFGLAGLRFLHERNPLKQQRDQLIAEKEQITRRYEALYSKYQMLDALVASAPITTLLEQSAQLKQQGAALAAENRALRKENEELRAKNAGLLTQRAGLEGMRGTLINLSDTLRTQTTALAREVTEERTANEALKLEKSELEARNAVLERDKAGLERKLASLTTGAEGFQRQIREISLAGAKVDDLLHSRIRRETSGVQILVTESPQFQSRVIPVLHPEPSTDAPRRSNEGLPLPRLPQDPSPSPLSVSSTPRLVETLAGNPRQFTLGGVIFDTTTLIQIVEQKGGGKMLPDSVWGQILAQLQVMVQTHKPLELHGWRDTVTALKEYYLLYLLGQEGPAGKFVPGKIVPGTLQHDDVDASRISDSISARNETPQAATRLPENCTQQPSCDDQGNTTSAVPNNGSGIATEHTLLSMIPLTAENVIKNGDTHEQQRASPKLSGQAEDCDVEEAEVVQAELVPDIHDVPPSDDENSHEVEPISPLEAGQNTDPPRLLRRSHIDILWTCSSSSSIIFCMPCNTIGATYELPTETKLAELLAHSETAHPDLCDVILEQTQGMSDEQVRAWFEGLDT